MSWEVSDLKWNNFHESAEKYYSRDLFYNQTITKVLQSNFANEYKYIIKQTRNTASVPCICCIANLTSFSVTDGNSSTPLCTRKHLNPLIPALTMGLISACFDAHAIKKVFYYCKNDGSHLYSVHPSTKVLADILVKWQLPYRLTYWSSVSWILCQQEWLSNWLLVISFYNPAGKIIEQSQPKHDL